MHVLYILVSQYNHYFERVLFFNTFFHSGMTFLQGREIFIFKTHVSKEDLKHEEIQNNMELVLLCISIAAVLIALALLIVLRLAVC